MVQVLRNSAEFLFPRQFQRTDELGKQGRFWYPFCSPMKSISRFTSSNLRLPVIVIGIIASLCFSVGEGLRLTPFPFSALTRAKAANIPLDAKSSLENSLHKYGPLDVPTHTQKRSKRQAVDFACPPSAIVRALPTYLHLSSDHEPFLIGSVVFVARPAGRAPPFLS